MLAMNKFIIIIFSIVVLGVVSNSNVQAQTRSGSTVANFLTVGMGATGSSLGHAYTASVYGAESMFWNPAGIARSGDLSYTSGSLNMSYFDWFADISMYNSALAFKINQSASIGFNISYVNYGQMEITTVDVPTGIGTTFGAYDLSFGLTYASKLTQNFHFGGTAKLIRQSIWDMSAQTIAIDLGFILETEYLNGMTIGATISNFGGKMQMQGINTDLFADIDPTSEGNNPDTPVTVKTDEWDLPLSFKFGFAIPVIKTEYVTYNVMSDIQQTNDNNLNFDFGNQLVFTTKTVQFTVNGGYKDFLLEDNVDSHFTYGVGVRLRVAKSTNVAFNISQVPFSYLGNTRMVDFKVFF